MLTVMFKPINFVERISKEVANIELKGAVTQEQYPARDGTWYTKVYFPKNALLEDVGQIFERNEDAAFAEFKAQQALGTPQRRSCKQSAQICRC